MLITGTIQEFASQHVARLKAAKEIESKLPVNRTAGCFPSQHAKDLRMTQINSQLAVYELVASIVIVGECEFCGDPATTTEYFDRPVPVCAECHA